MLLGSVGRLGRQRVFHWRRRQVGSTQHQQPIQHGEGETNQLNHLYSNSFHGTKTQNLILFIEVLNNQIADLLSKIRIKTNTPALLCQGCFYSVNSCRYYVQQRSPRLGEEKAVHANILKVRPKGEINTNVISRGKPVSITDENAQNICKRL